MANRKSEASAGEPSAERRTKIKQAISKARERIRTATGRDGNGLKDAAKRVSESVRARMSAKAEEARPSSRPKMAESSAQKAEPTAAKKAAEMAKEKVSRVKAAVASARPSGASRAEQRS